MVFELFANPVLFLVWFFALLVAISVHESSHALAADRLGDPTPRTNGRLTLNPLAHLDPVGTLMLLLTRFGWGKPVPIDPYNLENPRRDSALISVAGPASNLILAIALSFFAHMSLTLGYLLLPVITLNVSLAIFNLLPFPPLDGAKILFGFLPEEIALELEEVAEHYGLILLLFLLFPFSGQSLVSFIILPIINLILDLLL